jgi:hypothetical protein
MTKDTKVQSSKSIYNVIRIYVMGFLGHQAMVASDGGSYPMHVLPPKN